jgi:hypothetical protein
MNSNWSHLEKAKNLKQEFQLEKIGEMMKNKTGIRKRLATR